MPLELISQQEAADLLDVDRITVWKWTNRDNLIQPFQVIGGRPIFNKHDILAFKEARRQALERKRSEKAAVA